MLTLNEMILFGCVALFILCSAIWLTTQLVMFGFECIDEIKKKYFPEKYYYDWEDGR